MHRKRVLRTGYLLTLALLCAETCVIAGGAVSNAKLKKHGVICNLFTLTSMVLQGATRMGLTITNDLFALVSKDKSMRIGLIAVPMPLPPTASSNKYAAVIIREVASWSLMNISWHTGSVTVAVKWFLSTPENNVQCLAMLRLWVICPANCSTTEGVNVFGTERYAYESPVCAAAAHDLRMLPWRETVVSFRRSMEDLGDYRGSWRNRVTSKNKKPYGHSYHYGHYTFVSPRIEEPILDLTSVHVNYRNAQQSDHVQICFGPAGSQIEFTHFAWNTRKYLGTSQYDGVFKVVWNGAQHGSPFGAFMCSVVGRVLSSVTSVAMLREFNFPDTLSQTISVGEAAAIRNVNGDRVSWFKDGERARSEVVLDKRSMISIFRAQLGDGGIYWFQKTPGSPQVSRLIVRACPNGTYGHECKKRCPQCLNGGVCHDIMGVCICPPGFAGQHCERICPEYHFGQNCSHNCTEVVSLAGGEPRCERMLFCLPDPYGCSCYPGFRGIDCVQRCERDTYGADCKQRRACHCKGGESCDPQSGICRHRVCEEGYRGEPYCDRVYPVLKAFEAVAVDEDSIEVRWNRWNPSRGDKGEGKPNGYVIQFKEYVASYWNRTGIIEESVNDTLSFVITDLRANTWHQVQVLVHDDSGQEHSQEARLYSIKTPCGARSQWLCDHVGTQVEINGSGPASVDGYYNFTFLTLPFTAYRVQVRLTVNQGKKVGPWSIPYEFTTREAAPGEVGSLSAQRLSPKTYRLGWQPPESTNGILRFYHLKIQMRYLNGFKCPGIPLGEELKASIPANKTLFEAHSMSPSARYWISIRATTIADGPWKYFYLVTEEEVPEGPPRELRMKRVTEKSATVSWGQPDCRLINGPITGYLTNRTSSAPWVPSEVQEVVSEPFLDMDALVPFTEYTLTVWARNSIGVGPGANITFTTAPGVPPPPSNLTVYSATSKRLAVTWMPPYPPNGVLERYVVHYELVDDSSKRGELHLTPAEAVCDSEARAEERCAVLSNLYSNIGYHVLVGAKNKDVEKWSWSSDWVTAETRESEPGPPFQVRQQDRSETALTVVWDEPRLTNGVIFGYKVILAKPNSLSADGKTTLEVAAAIRQALLDNLEPGTAYEAAVSARTSAGYGEAVKIFVHTRPRIPVIETKVELKNVDDTAITLQLARAEHEPEDIKSYYVLVEKHDRGNRTKRSTDASDIAAGGALHEWTGGTPDYNESVAMNLSFYMAAKMAPHEVHSGRGFTVGDGLYYDGYYNAPLVPESTYSVGLAAEVDFEGDRRISYRLLSDPITVRRLELSTSSSTPTAVIICVLILMVVAMVAVWKWRKQIIGKLPRSFPQKPAAPASDAASLSVVEENDRFDFEMEEISGGGNETTSKPLPVSDLQEHVQRMLACDGLKSEFTNQPMGLRYPAIEAQRTENKIKNRYGNLLAYDHSRVKLTPIPGVSYSDYINANYIDGYCRPKRYIATQGPKPRTVDDFWRMVWQENVCKIVMLTGIVEHGKTKCEKYWPEKMKSYGDIQVQLISEEKFPDYAIHHLHITLADTTREVKHFHLTSWPDHGVPLYPNTVLTFRRKVNQYRTFNEAPVVVHCSAGVGRTGTYILLDSTLEQAQAEGVVDVHGQLSAMRQRRMNVVETLEQYNFVHRALMESVCIRDHSVPCSKMHDRYRVLLSLDEETGKSNISKEFEELKSIKSWFKPEDFIAASGPADLRKSRDISVLAPDRCRPLLRDGTFVNAVYVNGFQKKDKFLVTQTPSSKDAESLWQLVIESGARTIVTLDVFSDGDDVVPVRPTSGSVRYGDHKVECTDDRYVNDMSVQTFKVTSKHKAPGSSGPVTVKHFHRSTWNSAEQMVDLVDHVERWQQQCGDKIIFVQCRNGCLASGLFCCCVLVLEKLKWEQEVDVFYATRIVRENRPQFISDCDQYKLCYDTALAYLQSFEMYSNFR